MASSPPVLTPEEADHFRERLGQEATRLRGMLTSLERGLDSPDQDANEDRSAAMDEDAAAELTAQEQYGSQARDIAHSLQMVERALERLEAGTYGRCSDCGQAIPMARLEFLPTAERCVACEGRRETSHRR